jgi:hypothetical protein
MVTINPLGYYQYISTPTPLAHSLEHFDFAKVSAWVAGDIGEVGEFVEGEDFVDMSYFGSVAKDYGYIVAHYHNRDKLIEL